MKKEILINGLSGQDMWNYKNKNKNETIKTYQKKENVQIFDNERRKYLFQRYKHEAEANFLKSSIDSVKKKDVKVLDVACGTGRMLPEVFKAAKNISYVGADTSVEMMRELQKKARLLNKIKEVETIIADATNLPFRDNTFDVVYSFHLLWHIEKSEQEKVINEMKRVVRPGGVIIFDILNKNFIWEKVKNFMGIGKSEGLFKTSLKEIRTITSGMRNIKLKRLSDAPIKNDSFYRIFNLINKSERFMPSIFYHMIYVRAEK